MSQGWERVTSGESGAVVLRSADGSRYAKFVTAEQQAVLEAERNRIDWAAGCGVPTAQVLDWATSSEWACLLTGAVDGVSADRLPASALWRAWPSITATLRRLHDTPAWDCPFTRGLAEMFTDAENVVSRGAVNPQFLPAEFRQTPPAELLTQLRSEEHQRQVEEAVDLVVCHGDLCLPNVMLDPATHAVTGLIDLGRLGRADRYADIALLLANSRGTWTDEAQATAADAAFEDGYGITLSPDRRLFYLCLDGLTWDTAA
jgi:streptomycin 3"-kinase